MLSGIVYTDQERCEACSACLRVCETKSIMIKDGKSKIIEESCLNCGACVKVCSKGAKKYRNSIEGVENILKNKKAALILAPSYVIVAVKKYNCTPEQFCTALKELGFELVYESSFGADVVTKLYVDYINDLLQKQGRENTNVIASPCPALMNYVEKHTPELLNNFAPIVSPMAAQAVIVRYWNGDEIAIVGATPCLAKKSELLDEEFGLYAEKMTFEELITLLDSRGIVPANLPESDFDGVQPFYGTSFPISGGLTKTMEQYSTEPGFDIISNNYLLVEGEDRSTKFLKGMARKATKDGNLIGYPLLVDILYCEGCILGKALGVSGNLWENRRIVSEYTRKRFKRAIQENLVKEYKGYSVLVKNTIQAPEFEKWLEIVDQLIKENKFTRTWNNVHYHKKEPTAEELRYILEYDGKHSEKDELNCGACGYETCRERAIAVFNGENELGGCIVHIKYEARLSLEENKRLQELDQMKSDFLSTVSHELRTPLTSVLGFSKIIKKRLEEVVFPQIKTTDKKVNRAIKQVNGNVDIIVSESQRLTNLISDVLDLSKMEAGKIEWKMEPLCLEEVIDRAISATTSLFEQKGLELVKDIEEGLPQIMGDRDRLIQTVINLISNAIKFTDSGSVTCRARRVDDDIVLGVVDTGIGVAEDDLEKVFNKFKQVGDTLTDKPQGTGLGLSICKQIVEQHGGRIWVESEQGKGSTFSFAIPMSTGQKTRINKINVDSLVKQMKKQMATAVDDHTKSRKNILVVDDDSNIRNLLRQELKAAGYLVAEAADGVEAISLIKKNIPDLILLDVMMPKMSGFDVAAVLKNDPTTMNIPIIIVSIIENRERGYSIGVDRYFTKPLNTEDLLKEIGLLLSQGVSKKKVLVVDEDKSTLKTLVDVLQARGYVVVEAGDTEECITKALAEKPDMIILNSLFSERNKVMNTLRFEKGLENILFLFAEKIIEI